MISAIKRAIKRRARAAVYSAATGIIGLQWIMPGIFIFDMITYFMLLGCLAAMDILGHDHEVK